MSASETIFALSTGALPSGIAVVRISGTRAGAALAALFGHAPAPRRLEYGPLRADGDLLDYGMAVYFPGPGTATGEDCAELHVHGSVAVVRALLAALSALPGLREAEPGEFTLRAFHNGRLDLTAVESLSDLMAAETATQRRQALGGLSGAIRDICLDWRRRLLTLRAHVEADLDFSDQDDVPLAARDEIVEEVDGLVGDMDAFMCRVDVSEIIRQGYRIAIVGEPNAGKSSLLNALARRDVAIVTAEPGTTRDLVEVSLDLGGDKVVLTDTAGIRETDVEAERIGVERARSAALDADLILSLRAPDGRFAEVDTDGDILRVGTKADIGLGEGADLWISSLTGEGIGLLTDRLTDLVSAKTRSEGAMPVTRRQVECVRRARSELLKARDAVLPELIAEHLRSADSQIGRIVGVSDVEELLGEIFSRFCIGK